MVCNRCIMVVQQELNKLRLIAISIALGEIQLSIKPSDRQLSQLKANLANVGFEILDDSRKKLIEK